jgi:hypothetical protein
MRMSTWQWVQRDGLVARWGGTRGAYAQGMQVGRTAPESWREGTAARWTQSRTGVLKRVREAAQLDAGRDRTGRAWRGGRGQRVVGGEWRWRRGDVTSTEAQRWRGTGVRGAVTERSWSGRGGRTRGADIEEGARARAGEVRGSGLGTGHARDKAATCACGVAGVRVMGYVALACVASLGDGRDTHSSGTCARLRNGEPGQAR